MELGPGLPLLLVFITAFGNFSDMIFTVIDDFS